MSEVRTLEAGKWADWAGMTASIGCAIHCAAMPLVLAYLPALGLGWLADEGFHQWMAVLCFGLAAAAFVPGWKKHRSLAPIGFGAAGLALLTYAAFGLECACCASATANSAESETATVACSESCCSVETNSAKASAKVTAQAPSPAIASFIPVGMVTPLGGLLLVVGHVVNHRKGCRCRGDRCCTAPTMKLQHDRRERDQDAH